jgi:fructose-bisphosphate aldolase class 1
MPKLHVPVNPEERDREIRAQFSGAIQENALRHWESAMRSVANTLRQSREADHKAEFENLFVRRPCN